MKSRTVCITAMTLLAALAIPAGLGAQVKEIQKSNKHHHYQLIDMGTFGGPASFINPPFNVFSSLSSEGMTVGSSATAIPINSYSNFFVCGGLDGVVPNVFHAFAWQNGTVADLGSLGGSSNCSNAAAVNARGEIVGESENGVVDPLFGVNQFHAVLWEDGSVTDLGTLGGDFSGASGINSRGQAVGFALNGVLDPVSMLDWQIGGSTLGTQTRAFVWQHGALKDLGTLGGPDAWGAFVNDPGQVAGYSYTNSTINSTTGIPTTHPFLWKNGAMTDLGTLGGTLAGSVINNMLGGLNNRGQVVGLSTVSGDQGCTGSVNGCTLDPFLWSQGKMIDLYTSSSGGNPLTANAINDAGEVVGAAAFPTQVYDAYIWRDGVATDLGHLDGDCYSEAWAINSRGQVTGISFSCDFNTLRVFLWQNSSIIDLNTLIPPGSNLQLTVPMAINDQGAIAGVGAPPGVCSNCISVAGHAFLAIPNDRGAEESATSVAKSNAHLSQYPTAAAQDSPAAFEIVARLRARMARRYLGPSSQLRK